MTFRTATQIGHDIVAAACEPLSGAMESFMASLAVAEKHDVSLPAKLTEIPLYKIVDNRLKFGGVNNVTEYAKAVVCGAADRPGMVVMYAAALKVVAQKYGTASVETLRQTFPNGFPTESEMHRIWESQKLDSAPDNSLDRVEAWGDA